MSVTRDQRRSSPCAWLAPKPVLMTSLTIALTLGQGCSQFNLRSSTSTTQSASQTMFSRLSESVQTAFQSRSSSRFASNIIPRMASISGKSGAGFGGSKSSEVTGALTTARANTKTPARSTDSVSPATTTALIDVERFYPRRDRASLPLDRGNSSTMLANHRSQGVDKTAKSTNQETQADWTNDPSVPELPVVLTISEEASSTKVVKSAEKLTPKVTQALAEPIILSPPDGDWPPVPEPNSEGDVPPAGLPL